MSSTYLDSFGYEARDVARGAELDDLLHVSRVLLAVRAEGASVGVRVNGMVHATLEQAIKEKVQCSGQQGSLLYSTVIALLLIILRTYLNNIELPVLLCGGTHGAGGVAMVGVPERYDIVGAGVQPRHHDGELVGLRAGVGEEDHLSSIMHPATLRYFVRDK